MIKELSELGKKLRDQKTGNEWMHDALKEEPISLETVISEDGNFQKFELFEKKLTIAEAITAKKGKARLLLDKAEEVLCYGGETSKKKHELFLEKRAKYQELPELSPGRCTVGCPVGLRLDDLWTGGKEALRQRGEPPAPEWVKATAAATWADRLAAWPRAAAPPPRYTSLTADRHTFSACVQCQTCTNVCPVVAHSDRASGVDATPQKVMTLLRLGLADLALGSRMVWDCATCYQCQEHCPAGIRVTEVLYELRNRGYERLGGLPRPERAALHGHEVP